MSFEVSASAYARFMGRYSEPLAVQFAELAGARPGHRALDVGCGPGALTAELVRRLGAAAVCAVEPSPPFACAARERLPGVDVRQAAAEDLPFPDGRFDVALAQLVVHFMADPVAALREMARVTRPGGTIAACVWDQGGRRSPTTLFWHAVRQFDPSARDESERAGTHEGDLLALFARAGLDRARPGALTVEVTYPGFEEWWEPYTLGVGPAGAYVASLADSRRRALRQHCQRLLPAGPVRVSATAWVALAQRG